MCEIIAQNRYFLYITNFHHQTISMYLRMRDIKADISMIDQMNLKIQ